MNPTDAPLLTIIDAQKARIAKLEDEVNRLRSLLSRAYIENAELVATWKRQAKYIEEVGVEVQKIALWMKSAEPMKEKS